MRQRDTNAEEMGENNPSDGLAFALSAEQCVRGLRSDLDSLHETRLSVGEGPTLLMLQELRAQRPNGFDVDGKRFLQRRKAYLSQLQRDGLVEVNRLEDPYGYRLTDRATSIIPALQTIVESNYQLST